MYNPDFENITLTSTTELNETEKLKKRARAKYLTNAVTRSLLTIEDTELKGSYLQTLNCADVVIYNEEKKKWVSHYCKQRWCLVCNRIKTAVNINQYLPEIQTWDNPFFVTLTIPNIPAKELSVAINDMLKQFTNIKRVIAYRRKKEFKAVRKLEVTYNPNRNDYHPHFHIITNGGDIANLIHDEWLKRYPDAREVAQDYRPADNNAIIELFKYFTKILSTKSVSKNHLFSGDIEMKRAIYINALDNIFTVVKGRRTFQSYGFKLKKIDEKQEEDVSIDDSFKEFEELYHNAEFLWKQELSDWLNHDTGELLSGYEVSESIKEIEKSII